MNPPAKKNEAYQPTVIEQTANIITHGVKTIFIIVACCLLHKDAFY